MNANEPLRIIVASASTMVAPPLIRQCAVHGDQRGTSVVICCGQATYISNEVALNSATTLSIGMIAAGNRV